MNAVRRRRRRRLTGLLAASAIAAGVWYRLSAPPLAVPARIRLDEVTDDLTRSLERAEVLEENPDAPVRLGWLRPSDDLGGRGAFRRAVMAIPPSSIRYRLRVPPDGTLELAAGVAAPAPRDPTAAGVRFGVTVEGREVYSRVINPAADTHDDRWRERRIELAAAAGHEVEIVLTTRAAGSRPLAGVSGWSRLRMVRSTWRPRQHPSPTSPSVLVLLVDALRTDRLGVYGAQPSPSPTLDALASSGTVFEQAIAQAPWTLPAVATLLTGFHPAQHGVVGGRWRWGERDPAADVSRSALPERVATLATLAQQGGITTAGVTANGLVSPGTGLARGFEHWLEVTGNTTASRFARAAAVNGHFVAWLRENAGHRFLAYLHYMETHAPYEPPGALPPANHPELAAVARTAKIDDLRPVGAALDGIALSHVRALYDDCIHSWDTELAGLLEALEAVGVARSTVVIVLADHGEAFQEHGYLGHGIHLHDELLRVPLVIAGPGIPRGRRVPRQVQHIDFLPTVAGILGLAVPSGLPGHDLFTEASEEPAVASTAFWSAPDGSRQDLLAWRTGTWKLMHAPATGHYELYDLARDPAERENRFGQAPESVALAEALAAWQALAPPPEEEQNPEVEDRLRALGYVE